MNLFLHILQIALSVCGYSKDIARQPRENRDGRRHSQKAFEEALVVRKQNITIYLLSLQILYSPTATPTL